MSSGLAKRLGRDPPLEWLLHPVTLVALGIMIFNDGWLRGAYPGWITGKLSDVAAVVAFPAVVAALWSLTVMGLDRVVGRFASRSGLDYSLRRSVVLGALALTGGVLIGINLSTDLRDAYLAGLRRLDVLGLFGPYHYTMDASDLVALLGLPIPWVVAERRIRRVPAGRLRAALRRARRRSAEVAPGLRGEAALDAAQGALRDVRRGLPRSRLPALDQLARAVAEAALATADGREPSLAPSGPDHYHRIVEALTAHRTPGSTP